MPNMCSVTVAGFGITTNVPNSSLSHFTGAVRPLADFTKIEG